VSAAPGSCRVEWAMRSMPRTTSYLRVSRALDLGTSDHGSKSRPALSLVEGPLATQTQAHIRAHARL
jgi:hypothetical protein